jgi:hypothetical protein
LRIPQVSLEHGVSREAEGGTRKREEKIFTTKGTKGGRHKEHKGGLLRVTGKAA